MKNGPIIIYGDGSNVRSYLYCKDVAEAIEIILHRVELGHVYNIGSERKRGVIDIASDICRLFSVNQETLIRFVGDISLDDPFWIIKTKNIWDGRSILHG